MIYALLEFLDGLQFPGHNLMGYITFRAGISFALALLIVLMLGH